MPLRVSRHSGIVSYVALATHHHKNSILLRKPYQSAETRSVDWLAYWVLSRVTGEWLEWIADYVVAKARSLEF